MIRTLKHPIANLESYMEHIEYGIELIGIDHVGCGPDTMYGDHIGLYRRLALYSKLGGFGHTNRSKSEDEVLGISIDLRTIPEYVKGLENPTESSKNIVRNPVKLGYSD